MTSRAEPFVEKLASRGWQGVLGFVTTLAHPVPGNPPRGDGLQSRMSLGSSITQGR
jgi:hypothetical protein